MANTRMYECFTFLCGKMVYSNHNSLNRYNVEEWKSDLVYARERLCPLCGPTITVTVTVTVLVTYFVCCVRYSRNMLYFYFMTRKSIHVTNLIILGAFALG